MIRPIHTRELNGGEQKIYRFGHYGLSVVNSPMAHSYPFAWEAAVIKFNSEDWGDFKLCYDTELTNDVVVFKTSTEAARFILRASKVLKNLTEKERIEAQKNV